MTTVSISGTTVTGVTTADGVVTLEAGAVSTGNLEINANVTAGGANGIVLDALDGDLVLDALVDATGDAVLLQASGTLDVTGGSADIAASDLALRADTVSGTLPGDVDNLAASITGTSDFAFTDSSDLTVTTVSVSGTTVTGVATTDGTLSISTTGDLDVAGPVTAGSDNDATLDAGTALLLGDDVDVGTGTLNLVSGTTINQTGRYLERRNA